jgi:group I intron endonuclease
MCLIYKIINLINKKVYIGQTWSTLKHRLAQHLSSKKKNKLFDAIKKYGKENFQIQFLTVCGTQEVADYWETFFIEKYDSINLGYNIREGGSRGKLSSYTRKKISDSHQGKKLNLDVKLKISASKKGQLGPNKGKRTNPSRQHAEKGTKPWNTGTKGIMVAWNKNRIGNERLFSKETEILISKSQKSSRTLAKEYGVSKSLILKIRKRYEENK